MASTGHSPQITPLDGDRSGLRIVDPIEQAQYVIYADVDAGESVEVDRLDSIGEASRSVPVDATASIETDGLEIPKRAELCVRDLEFNYIDTIRPDQEKTTYDLDRALLQVWTVPIKTYLQINTSFDVAWTENSVRLSFGSPSSVVISVRSVHEQPATTIEIADEHDLAAALSRFGSALKTTSPERSFPTQRGHPPLVEIGDERSIPDGLARPDVGVRLVVPPEPQYLFPAASIAYYLGASVEIGSPPELFADDVRLYLGHQPAFESEVNRLLRRVFLLDCVCRTVGLFQMDLHERTRLEEAMDESPDWEALYEASIGERVREYLDARFDPILDVCPEWHQTTDVTPAFRHAEILPFVASELSLIRCARRKPTPSYNLEPRAVSDFYRGPNTDGVSADGGPSAVEPTRGVTKTTELDTLEVVRPLESESVEHLWVGDEYPLGANKLTADACRRRLLRSPMDGDSPLISIDIVCNEPSMAEEETVEEVYGLRDFLEYDVTIHQELSTAELAQVLESSTDFVHYIGHVDDEGIRCPDGAFDARSLDSTGADAFLLNACQSYEQGEALLDAGCVAGVATLTEISNAAATRMGRQLARLLNTGLTLRAALEILRNCVGISYRYTVLGDGSLQLVQSESGCPSATIVSPRRNGDDYEISFRYYPTSKYSVGTIDSSSLDAFDSCYLGIGSVGPREISADELVELSEFRVHPVEVSGKLHWNYELADVLDLEADRNT